MSLVTVLFITLWVLIGLVGALCLTSEGTGHTATAVRRPRR